MTYKRKSPITGHARTQFAREMITVAKLLPDGEFDVKVQGRGTGKAIRIVGVKSKGGIRLVKATRNEPHAVPALKASSPAKRNPMGKVKKGEFPFVDRDMGDVEAELHASLDPSELANRIGLSRVTISNYRSKGRILGLSKGNRYVFPSWQLDKSGQIHPVMRDILQVLRTITEDPIDLLILLISGLDFFKGRSVKDFLIAGDSESALQEARMIAKA